MKRLFFVLTLILAALLSLSSCDPGFYFPDEEEDEEVSTPGLLYTLDDNGYYSVSVGTATNESDIIIPGKYQGKEVKRIAEGGFAQCQNLVSVKCDENVREIGAEAFRDCKSLTAVSVSETLEFVNVGAFSGCASLKSINLPCGTDFIGENAFDGCTSLESVGDLSEVETIFDYAFRGCESLENINVGDKLRTVWHYAFSDCKNLKEITIPDSTHLIGINAFENCEKLARVTLGNGLTNINEGAFRSCTALESISIPNSVLLIGKSAFENCSSLKSLSIGTDVEQIASGAFSGCTSVEEIYFNAKGLDNPEAVNYIFRDAGKSGKGITLTVGKDTTYVPNCLFCPTDNPVGAPKIVSLVFEEGGVVSKINPQAFAYIEGLTSVTIADTVEVICESAFYSCTGLKEITISDSVAYLSEGAFEGCRNLEAVNFGKGLIRIGTMAFAGCASITEITLPSGITEIESDAFCGCTALKEITIPKSVTYISESAFFGCTALADVYFEGTEAEWEALGNIIFGGESSDSSDSVTVHFNRNATDEKNHVTKPFNQVKYVAFGDSITYGIDGVDWGRMEKPYPTLVSECLGFYSMDNRAVSGATLAEGTDGRTNMTKNILSFNGEADIISVMLGVNDFAVSRPLGDMSSRTNSTIYGSLHLIADYLTKNYPDAFIFFMTPFDCRTGDNNNSQGYNLEDVANAVSEVASAYGIPVLDMYRTGDFAVEFAAKGDGIHPSQEHFLKYTAPQIVDFIEKNY